MNFYIINLENKRETYFEENELIIGRQLLENCNDKRISRTHAIIRLDTSGKFLWLISTHTNPVFHRSFQDADLLNVISKDDEKVILRCEDKFGLLSDKYWFEIKQKIDLITSNNNDDVVNQPLEVRDANRIDFIRVRNVEEVNQSCSEPEVEEKEDGENCTTNCIRVPNVEEVNESCNTNTPVEEIEDEENRTSNCIRVRNVEEVNESCNGNIPVEEKEDEENRTTNCLRVRNVEEVNESCNGNTPVKRKLPDWMMSTSNNSNKKKKDDLGSSSSQAIYSTNSNIPIQTNDTELPNEETVITEMENPPDSPIRTTMPDDNTNGIIKSEIKEEPSSEETGGTSTSTKTNTTTKLIIKKDPDPIPVNLRPSCSFGIRCYRRNPAHRSSESHPGDSDYRRPSFPEPAVGTPPCPYGSQCYRRNPFHFQQFSHPPSTNAKQNRRNARKAKNNSNLNQNVLFSDEESDKDFSGDSDSDGYVPGNNMDESSESSNYSINSEP